MSKEIESILLAYHADKMSKQQAIAEIEGLIDAERVNLRDTFAGQAMAAYLTGATTARPDQYWKPIDLSGDAYQVADAMLEARNK